jgi:hypothetical protein
MQIKEKIIQKRANDWPAGKKEWNQSDFNY